MKPAPACDTTAAANRADLRALTLRVLHALERVNWPAHPATLIESAEHSGAPSDVVQALRQLPDEAFGSFAEVSASIVAAQLRAHDAVTPDHAGRR